MTYSVIVGWTEKSIYKMEKVVHNLNISYGLEIYLVIDLSPYEPSCLNLRVGHF